MTPLDIKLKRFKKKTFGIDPVDVEEFLDEVRDAWEDLLRQMRGKEEEVEQLEKVLVQYRERESTLKQTLISAQKVSEDIKKNSHKEAKVIIEQAEIQADKMLIQAHGRLKEIISQINGAKRQKAEFVGKLSGFIDSHKNLLEMMEEESKEKNLEDIGLLPKSM